MAVCVRIALLLLSIGMTLASPSVPFYRYWNKKNHFYTTNIDEIGTSQKGLLGKNGYTSYGTACNIYPVQVPGSLPLYRYNDGKNHFYTQNAKEIGTIVPGVIGKNKYASEGIAGYCFPQKQEGTVPLYRYYRYRGQADHFYTVDAKVIGTTKPGATGKLGYKSEGIACWVPPAQENPSKTEVSEAIPFYRYWNNKDHFYTTNANEIGTTKEGLLGKNGYTSYGTECKLYPTRVSGSRPLYRYFDGKNHFYTQNAEEIGTIVPGVIGKSKYKSEGIAGYCFPQEHKGTVPFYRYYRYSGQADHYYTVDVADIGTIIPGTTGHHGYKYEGIACWVVPAQNIKAVNLYRYWNGKNYHLYTTDINEIGTGTKGQTGKDGYKSEGVEAKIFSAQAPGTKPLYRYKGYGANLYTLDAAEIGVTVPGQVRENYKAEGIVGYCYPQQQKGTIPLYRYFKAYDTKTVDHFYTTDAKEIGTVTAGAYGNYGYKAIGIACYVLPLIIPV